jgi:hypothetical protein
MAMIGMGVDNIITDEPAAVRRWLDEWNELTHGERIALALGSMIMDVERPEPPGQ